MEALQTYWTDYEQEQFNRLFRLADAIIEEQDQLMNGVQTVETRRLYDVLGEALKAIHAERDRLLAVARGRARQQEPNTD